MAAVTICSDFGAQKKSDTERLQQTNTGFPSDSMVKNPAANAGNTGLNSGSGRFPREGNGNPLQYSCLGNSMNRGAWWTITHGGIVQSRTWLN